MQKITPNLWFDDQAEAAAELYASLFPNSKIVSTVRYPEAAEEVSGKKAGSVMTAEVSINGYHIVGLNGGPAFKLNPSASFIVNFDPGKDSEAESRLEAIYEKLSEKGEVLMELGKYPFSKKYGWVQDKFGVSWQLLLSDPKGEDRPFIVPSFLFVGEMAGKAEEAIKFYLSVFKDSKMGQIKRYGAGQEPDKEGTVMFADFRLLDQWLAAMDSAHKHDFAFNEAFSLMVTCEDQEEIDYYWEKLSAVPESEQCGWLKDKYGISWQIIPKGMGDFFEDPAKAEKGMAAFLKMKKIEIAALEEAIKG